MSIEKAIVVNNTKRIITLRSKVLKSGKQCTSTLEPGINSVPVAFLMQYKKNKVVQAYFDNKMLSTVDELPEEKPETPQLTPQQIEEQRLAAELEAQNNENGGDNDSKPSTGES